VTLPAPPSPFPPINVHFLPAGTVLHRNHASSFAPERFNPCLGQASRFAPFHDHGGACVPTLYAATSREAAAFETVFHDIEPDAAFKTVRLEVVAARSASMIGVARALRLAALFAPDLKAWGLRRAELIDTPHSAYGQTVRWAQAIHAATRDLDGLIWTSRQCDPDRCVMLFGDRVSPGTIAVRERRDVGTDADLLLELRGYGRRAGIVIIS
jgi:hypothetical protein